MTWIDNHACHARPLHHSQAQMLLLELLLELPLLLLLLLFLLYDIVFTKPL